MTYHMIDQRPRIQARTQARKDRSGLILMAIVFLVVGVGESVGGMVAGLL